MIKFRAWDKGKEIYLYNVQDAYDTLSGNVQYDDGEDAEYDEDCFGGFLDNERYDVEQFTGMKDAQDDEIYENDLVRITDDFEDPVYKVIFEEAKFEISGGGVCYDLGEEFMNCEIVGNVHTNPELLEENE